MLSTLSISEQISGKLCEKKKKKVRQTATYFIFSGLNWLAQIFGALGELGADHSLSSFTDQWPTVSALSMLYVSGAAVFVILLPVLMVIYLALSKVPLLWIRGRFLLLFIDAHPTFVAHSPHLFAANISF
jgi:hypothetical protein